MNAPAGFRDEFDCGECDRPAFRTDTEVTHHVGPGHDGIDYDADAHHAPYESVRGCSCGTADFGAPGHDGAA